MMMMSAASSSRPVDEDTTKYNPLHKSAEADKFQIFEQWLRDNGAQFPLLELRQYENNQNSDTANSGTKNNDKINELYDHDDSAEEKKDGGGSDMGESADSVAMMSLDNHNNNNNRNKQKNTDDDDDGSNEMHY